MCAECTTLVPELKEYIKLKLRQDDIEEKVNKISADQVNYDTRMTKCELDIEEINKKMKAIEEAKNESEALRIEYDQNFPRMDAKNLAQQARPELANIVRSEISERELMEKLKDNLVIAGIAEKGSNEADQTEVTEVINKELGIHLQISETERIGKIYEPRDGEEVRPRLLRLKFTDKNCRKQVLTSGIKLRNSATADVKNTVFIRPDLTWKQREEQKNLRDLLRKKRAENPTRTYKISKNEIKETTPRPQQVNNQGAGDSKFLEII